MHPRLHPQVPKNAANRACYGCGSSSRSEYVDLGVTIDYEGGLVLCGRCVANLGQLIGMITPKDAEKLQARVVELEAGNAALVEIAGKHSNLVAALEEVNVQVSEPAVADEQHLTLEPDDDLAVV